MNYWTIFSTPTRRAGHLRILFALGVLIAVSALTQGLSISHAICALLGAALVTYALNCIHDEYLNESAPGSDLKPRKKKRGKHVERTLSNPRETRLRNSRAELSRTRSLREAYYHSGHEITVGELAHMDQLAMHERAIQRKIEFTASEAFGKVRKRPKP